MQVSGLTSDQLTADLFTVLVRLVKRGQHEAMAITSAYDLTLTQLRLLYVLDHEGEVPLSALAGAVGVSLAATARGGCPPSSRAGEPHRGCSGSAREAHRAGARGQEAVDQITRARFSVVDEFVAALDPHEREQLTLAVATLDDLSARHLPPLPDSCAAPQTPPNQTPDRMEQPA